MQYLRPPLAILSPVLERGLKQYPATYMPCSGQAILGTEPSGRMIRSWTLPSNTATQQAATVSDTQSFLRGLYGLSCHWSPELLPG